MIRETPPNAPSSCEQGLCGTCETKVLAGTPDPHDMLLTDGGRGTGDGGRGTGDGGRGTGTTMTICVGRSRSARLTLDLQGGAAWRGPGLCRRLPAFCRRDLP
ncbi:2Fe-2S iron-sulfur cluster-binding protein [Streptomyces sp. NPDC003444]